jgi:glycosyltransferase involved in cell wall biosynthesis
VAAADPYCDCAEPIAVTNAPRVTVLISAYNEERFLAEAIDSVLAQTFPLFEIVVVNDASTDRSGAIAAGYRDPRVRVIENSSNLGPGPSLNRGLASIRSEYVARLDADDLCFPQRLAMQVEFLDAHPEVAAVGCQAVVIDARGRRVRRLETWYETTEWGIRWRRIFQMPLIHSAAMFRRAIVWDLLGGYEERYRFGEDFELFDRIGRRYPICNLRERLIGRRVYPGSYGAANNPARAGYLERKIPMLHANMREGLQWDDVPERWAKLWAEIGDHAIPRTAGDIREFVDGVERCAARFAELYPEGAANSEVVAHQALMLARALGRIPAAGRRQSIAIWRRVFRRHRSIALRGLPRWLIAFLFGDGPAHVWRAVRWRPVKPARQP